MVFEEFLVACAVEMLKSLIILVLMELKEASSVKEDLKKLNSTLSIIQMDKVEDVEKQQMEKEALREWLEGLKDVTYDADDMLDKFSYHVMHEKEMSGRKRDKLRINLSRSNPLVFRLRMADKIRKINERLDVVARNKVWLDLPCRYTSSPLVSLYEQIKDNQETTSFIHNSRIIGREKDKEKIINVFLETISCSSSSSDSRVSVVPIVGMAGLGKTTLARLIYNDEGVSDTFELRIWVHVSIDFDVKKILRHIIESATHKTFDKDANMDMLERIMKDILSDKRYLLVLDDVWNLTTEVWNKLKTQLNVGKPGSNIIVTTRSNQVANVCGREGSTHALKGLSEPECWSVLRQIAFSPGGAEETPNLVGIGREIVRKCGGVPLAARSLGELLHSMKTSEEWSSIRDSKSWGLAGENQVLPALRLSYRYLPSRLKQCFAYCSLFPKDSLFEKQSLIQLWMAEGFLQPSDGNREKQLEDIGNDHFNSLLQNSLLQEATDAHDGDTQRYKLHHLMHDLAKDVVGNYECSIIKVSEIAKEDISKVRRLRLIFDEGRIICPEKLEDDSKLRTLFVQTQAGDNYINYGSIFNYQKLRVLDLQQCTSIKELPKSVAKMKHLRYLDLSYTLIEGLPESISRLYNLQTLLLRCCPRLKTFPDNMGMLKRLRYLDLSGSNFVILPESITHLSDLRTLKLKDCFMLKELPKHINKLIGLRHLIVSNSGSWNEMPREIGCLSRLQTLQVFKVDGRDGGSIRELGSLNSLESKLHISNLQHVTKPKDAKKANLKGKKSIQSLVLEWSCRPDDAECAIDLAVMEQLIPNPSLKTLKIVNYLDPRFPTWMTSNSISSTLPNLVELELEGCFICRELPGLGQLPSLKVLRIDTMNDVVCLGNDFYGDRQACQPFPELVKLTLCNLPRLKKWCTTQSTSPFYPRLEKLMVERCPNLERIREMNFIRRFFPSIKEYEVDDDKLISRMDFRRSIQVVRGMVTLKGS